MLNSGSISLRRLKDDEADYRRLEVWCSQEEVYRYFEQRILTPEEIRRKYRPRTREDAAVPVWMIEYAGKPVGIVQYQKMSEEECGYEIDLFIGEAAERGRGVGRESLQLIARYLFEEKDARLLVMCPMKENIRAIRCYRACGFTENGLFSAPDTVGIMQEYVRMIRMQSDGC